MIDYEILHNGEVKGICLEYGNKDERIGRDIVYAFDFDDPRNKNRFLDRVHSISNENVIVAKYVSKM